MPNENKDQQLSKANPQLPNAKVKSTITFEMKLQETVEKVRPFLRNILALRKRYLIINGIVLALTLAYLIFLSEPFYDSTVIILPDYGGAKDAMLGSLGGLASLAGVSVGQVSPNEIYQNLISSEAVLAPVIYAKYKTEKYTDSVDLIQYLKVKPDKSIPAALQKRAMFISLYKEMIKGRIVADVDKMTRILTITVEMPEARLSAEVVNNITQSIDNYVRTKRKSFASEQRQYIEKRLMEVKDSLSNAENKLMYFKEQNRMTMQSPALMLQQGRLVRTTEIMNAVYIELSKQLELARIAEVKDTPILNVKEFAQNPVIKKGPSRLSFLVIIMFLTVSFSSIYYGFRSNIKKFTQILGLGKGWKKRKNNKEIK